MNQENNFIMKKTILFTALLSVATVVSAQAPSFEWAKQIGGNGVDRGYSVTYDNSGNVIIAGTFENTVDFDPGASVDDLTSSGGFDYYVAKFDSAGNYLWASHGGDVYDDYIQSVTTDDSGNIYVTGYALINAGGSAKVYIDAKLDPSGNIVWGHVIQGSSFLEQGLSVDVDAAGNVYTTGSFSGTVDFDTGAGVSELIANSGTNNAFLLKHDANGDFVWVKNIAENTSDNTVAMDVTLDAFGNIYTTGTFWYGADFNPDTTVSNWEFSAGGEDVFVSKLDSLGNYIWAKAWGSPSAAGPERGTSISVDGSGNVYTTGFFQGTADFDPGAGTSELTSNERDVFVSKLDANGNFEWAKNMGSGQADMGFGIVADDTDHVYVTGLFQTTVDFDPGAGTHNLSSNGSNDAFIQKLDASGDFVWAHSFGGTDNDNGFSIKVDGSGNIYATGYFTGTTDVDPGAGINDLSATGDHDIFVLKWSEDNGVGLFENTTHEALSIYPNPATDVLNVIDISGVISIVDLTGKTVIETMIEKEQIDVSSLQPGVYLLYVQTEEGISSTRFVKE